jgi:hypothetical protein
MALLLLPLVLQVVRMLRGTVPDRAKPFESDSEEIRII